MKYAVAIAGSIAFLAGAAAAEPAVSADDSPATVCIRTIDIDHTRTPDNRTIQFYMRDGKVWQTRLTSYCPELAFGGFSYLATPADNICGNLQSIRAIRPGAVCEIGPLLPAPPAHGS
jgi:hypothetical protein